MRDRPSFDSAHAQQPLQSSGACNPTEVDNDYKTDTTVPNVVGQDVLDATTIVSSDIDDHAVRPNHELPIARHKPATRIGRYLVINVLGQGGMGTVYLAYDPELDRRLAIKVLLTRRTSERARKRLVREARALARLSHPNVVQVYDAGIHQGDVFVAMEFVGGTSVREWCQSDPPPTWRQVLDAFLEAGSGLAAAHDNGLIHRDIKPANLLRGNDGRVRVADFGLARGTPQTETGTTTGPETARARALAAADATSDTTSDTSETSGSVSNSSHLAGHLDETLTRTGTMMGTPAYMAPEQHIDGNVGAAADQYSFCVALYKGLYGRLPFAKSRDNRPGGLVRTKFSGALVAPPPESPVPSWVHQALVRGLATQPKHRYPSLRALLAVLRDDPEARKRTRRRRLGLASALVLVTGLAGWWLGQRALVGPSSCDNIQQELAGIWDPHITQRLRRQFVDTGVSYASTTAQLVVSALDDYARQWTEMRSNVCQVRQRNPAAKERTLLRLRDVCLEQRRGQLRATTAVLAEETTAEVITEAVSAVRELSPIAYCADTEALLARMPPPEDPVLRARVDTYRPRVERLEALHNAGKYQQGLAIGTELLTEIEQLGYPSLQAQAVFWVARLAAGAGDYANAEALFRQTIQTAAQADDAVRMARSWAYRLQVVGNELNRFDDAQHMMTGLESIAELADDEQTAALALNSMASVFATMGTYDKAKTLHERALTIREQTLGRDHIEVAESLNDLAIVLSELGSFAEAKALHQRALAIRERALGPDHPKVASSIERLAGALEELGAYTEARALYERSLAISERTLGPDHPDIATVLSNLGIVLQELGEFAAAKVQYERALSILEQSLGPNHPRVASALSNLGIVLHNLGTNAEALVVHRRSLAIVEHTLGPDHPDVASKLNNLAGLLEEMGSYREAQALHERCLAILEKHQGARHPYVGIALSNLARVFEQLGNYQRAQTLYKRSLAIYEQAVAPNHPYVGIALANLARLLRKMDRYAGSQATYERSLAILESALGPEHPRMATLLVGLSRTLVHVGELDRAEQLLDRAQTIQRQASAGDRSVLAPMLLGRGELLLARRRPARAVAVLQQALALDSVKFQADIQLALARALWAQGGNKARARALVAAARTYYRDLGNRPALAKVARQRARFRHIATR